MRVLALAGIAAAAAAFATAPAPRRRPAALRAQQPDSSENNDPLPLPPRHVAFVPDGNGRWASRRGLPRAVGHFHGGRAAMDAADACFDSGVEFVTLFLFSSENWNRPRLEVASLFRVIDDRVRATRAKLRRKNTRVVVIGDCARLPPYLRATLDAACADATAAPARTLVLAISYGGQSDIAQAAARLPAGEKDPRAALEAALGSERGVPDVDLVVRAGGEMRLSNFYLWQAAYAELIFDDALWPDIDADSISRYLAEFSRRRRRFGELPSADESYSEGSLLAGMAALDGLVRTTSKQ